MYSSVFRWAVIVQSLLITLFVSAVKERPAALQSQLAADTPVYDAAPES